MSVLKEKLAQIMNWTLRVELCSSKIHVLKSPYPVCQSVTLFESKVFADDQVKMKLLRWPLIQYNQYLSKKRKFGHRDPRTKRRQCKDKGWTPRADWSFAAANQRTTRSLGRDLASVLP